jgi:O-antigen ligase
MGLVAYVFLAGLTDTFLIFSRTQILLLIITAIAMRWRKKERYTPEISNFSYR